LTPHSVLGWLLARRMDTVVSALVDEHVPPCISAFVKSRMPHASYAVKRNAHIFT
jgi:hypothetical protein